MCGICGFSGDMANYLGENNLREMLDIIIHRGPDDEGTYFKNNTALGMRRLSIIDLKSGHQPIHNEEKDIGVGMTFKDDEISTLLSGDLYALWLKDMKNDKYLNSFYHMPQWKDEVSQMLYFDQKVWLPKDVLIKSDKMTMANSIELRVPFLDYRIVEFASSIPSSLKYRGNNEKYILKKAFKDTLPSFVLNRKKNGFPVPLSSLLNLEFKNFAKDILLYQKSLSRGYFNKQYIENLFKKYNSTSYKGRQIWLLLTFELWNRIFIDSSNASLDEEMSVI
ncbi:asparagine synthase-related protein [Thermoanaerobacterium thermosaccharolyticum]|nr:asparagine synthase C-terminal domain-containing protein [Thermoanaerobacterium thermosaccharolyticum]